MTTPLYWKAWEIYNNFYETLLPYPFIAKMNIQSQLFTVQKSHFKLIPLYLAVMTVSLMLIFVFAVVAEVIIFHTDILSQSILTLYAFFLGAVGLVVLLMLLIMPHIEILCCHFWNRLIYFENKILKNSTSQNDQIILLLTKELHKFLRGEHYDKCGLLLIGLVVILIIAGIFIPIVILYMELDPLYKIIQIHCPKILNNFTGNIILFVVRSIWAGWCALEATRVYICVAIPTMTVCNIYLRIFGALKAKPLNDTTILLFHQFHFINQVVMPFIKPIAGALMGIGFFMFVFGNSMVISSWDVLPMELYFVVCGVLTICYFILFQTVPLAAKCNEVSCNLISGWKQGLGNLMGFRKYWIKIVKAQQPIALYYGFTKFEKSTKMNYYSNIVDCTISALLVQ